VRGDTSERAAPAQSSAKLRAMARRFVAFLLTLCMCWQTLAFAGAEVLVTEGQELAHAMLHFEGEAHHHHHDHDGDFHQDESLASVKHVMNDAGVFAPALLNAAALPLLTVCSDPPTAVHACEPPRPFLSGPERPPKALT
jgi:ABC-type nickel/cobalt efflux system permease component RcnA